MICTGGFPCRGGDRAWLSVNDIPTPIDHVDKVTAVVGKRNVIQGWRTGGFVGLCALR